MKKIILSILMVCGLLTTNTVSAYQVYYQIPFTFQVIKNGGMSQIPHKGPVCPLIAAFADGELLFDSATTEDYTLQLVDENDDVVYTQFVPAGTTSILLPTTLTGNFELRFVADTYYYYGYLTL